MESIFVDVEIETSLGAKYVFPDMDKRVFQKMVAQEDMWRKLGSFPMSNASEACLVVPVRIIKTIWIVSRDKNGEVSHRYALWKDSPASTASSP